MFSFAHRTGERKSLVNNVELKAPCETAGVAERRSTPHYWALNINRSRSRPPGLTF